MKLIKVLLAILIIGVLVQSSCDKSPPGAERVWSFWVENNSDQGIAFNVSYIYPDTSIVFEYESFRGCPINKRVPYDIDKPWEELFPELPSDTLSVFIFSSDTLQKYDWEKVKDDYNILKRYDLSHQDLENLGWVVKYP